MPEHWVWLLALPNICFPREKKKSCTKQYWAFLPVLKFYVVRVWLVSKLPTAANKYKIIWHRKTKIQLTMHSSVPLGKCVFHLQYQKNINKSSTIKLSKWIKDFNQFSHFLNESWRTYVGLLTKAPKMITTISSPPTWKKPKPQSSMFSPRRSCKLLQSKVFITFQNSWKSCHTQALY